jgi:hypothetical protein
VFSEFGEKDNLLRLRFNIYIQRNSETPFIACGDKLGGMTNELDSGKFMEVLASRGHTKW